MPQEGFSKLSRSNRPLYGPQKLLFCGFPAEAQEKVQTVLTLAGLSAVPVSFPRETDREETLASLMTETHSRGLGVDSGLPRAVITAGISEKQLMRLMTVCRRTGMRRALWATGK